MRLPPQLEPSSLGPWNPSAPGQVGERAWCSENWDTGPEGEQVTSPERDTSSVLWLRGKDDSGFSRGKWLWIPEKPHSWEGVGRRGRRKKSSVVSEGAAGSCKDVCPAHSFTSLQLGRPGVGMTGTRDQAWRRGVRELRLIIVPRPPILASPALSREPLPSPPQPLGDLGRLEKYVHLGVSLSACGPLTALKRGGVCVRARACFSLNFHQQEHIHLLQYP